MKWAAETKWVENEDSGETVCYWCEEKTTFDAVAWKWKCNHKPDCLHLRAKAIVAAATVRQGTGTR